ncbi:MAG: PAS domain-containing protein [bacterium]
MSDGLYIIDLQRRILYWNESAKKIIGYSKLEVYLQL